MIVSYKVIDKDVLEVSYLNAVCKTEKRRLTIRHSDLFDYKEVRVGVKYRLWNGRGCKPQPKPLDKLDRFRIMEIIRNSPEYGTLSVPLSDAGGVLFVDICFDGDGHLKAVIGGNDNGTVLLTTKQDAGYLSVLSKELGDRLTIKTMDNESILLAKAFYFLVGLPYISGFGIHKKLRMLWKRAAALNVKVVRGVLDSVPVLEYSGFIAPFCNMRTPDNIYTIYHNIIGASSGYTGSENGGAVYTVSGFLLLQAVERHTNALGDMLRVCSLMQMPVCFMTGRISMTEFLLFSAYLKKGLHTIDTPPVDSDNENHGGWNMSPRMGAVIEDVAEYDMRSFYSTIVVIGGISPESPDTGGKGVLPDVMRVLRGIRTALERKGRKEFALAVKNVISSVYGALSSTGCVYYTKGFGKAVTDTGRYLMQELACTANDYFRKQWATDTNTHRLLGVGTPVSNLDDDVVVYAVTDSLFLDFGAVIRTLGKFNGNKRRLIQKINYTLMQGLFYRKVTELFSGCDAVLLQTELQFNIKHIYDKVLFLSKNNYVAADNYGGVTVKGGLCSGIPKMVRERVYELLYLLLYKATSAEFSQKLSDVQQAVRYMTPPQLSFEVKVSGYSASVLNESDFTFVTDPSPAVAGLAWRNALCQDSAKYPQRIADGVYYAYYAEHATSEKRKTLFTYLPGEFPVEFAPYVDYDRVLAEFVMKPVTKVSRSIKKTKVNKK